MAKFLEFGKTGGRRKCFGVLLLLSIVSCTIAYFSFRVRFAKSSLLLSLEDITTAGQFNERTVMFNNTELLWPQPVTSSDSRFFHIIEKNLEAQLGFLFPGQKLIVYDIGAKASKRLNEYQREFLLRHNQVELRQLRSDVAATYYGRRRESGFRALILAEIAAEFGAVFYFDSSILPKHEDVLENMHRLLMHSIRPTGGLFGDFDELPNDDLCQLGSCYYPVAGRAPHSAYCATSQAQLDRFWINPELLEDEQPQNGAFFYYNTRRCIDMMLRPFLTCALEKGCMGIRSDSLAPRSKWNCYGQLSTQVLGEFNRDVQSVQHLLHLRMCGRNYQVNNDFVIVNRRPRPHK